MAISFSRATLEAWRTIRATFPTYRRCLGGGRCKSKDPAAHCPDCRRYLDAGARLGRELGLRPFDALPQCPGADPLAKKLARALDAAAKPKR